MKESVSYTVTLNFVIIFIVLVFAFLSATLIYYKSNKVASIIINELEKYEGYNVLSEAVIEENLLDFGYDISPINCSETVNAKWNSSGVCTRVKNGTSGYCIYECNEDEYYYYKVRTSMAFSFPIVNDFLKIPIFSNTNRLYNYEKSFCNQTVTKIDCQNSGGTWDLSSKKCICTNL